MTKKQKKSLFVLIGILLALVLVLLAVRAHNKSVEEKAESASSAEDSLTSADLQFTSIAYTNQTATLSFAVNESGSWYWVDDPDFPLDNDYLTRLSNTLTGLTPQQTITDGDTLDAYGLTDPAVTLTATETDGGTLTLALGNATADDSSNYYLLKDNDQSTVYVVSDTLYTELTRGIYDMMQLPDLPALKEADLSDITISGNVETTLSATISQAAAEPDSSQGDTSAESGSTITWRSSGTDVTGNEDVSNLVGEICALELDHCEDFKPSDQAISICGFDAPECVVSVNYTTESGADAAFTLTVANQTADGDSYYVRLNDDSTIYAVSAGNISTLLSIADSGLSQ